ncbi:class II aldolase/adducin family protein [Streptomyces iconiensis]|uniref:Class II aldolase/adducin family protein n=1 Tax=Streptomyces iconiensis TaxID=1384038 RepID=A0ABT6ZYA1_9ACTN|nr:class II aldolase/adducin family protein [Streptomyces iconiensis]MDJ1133616.1 class II aldolase/adducin family protein [Streptomyces iconiensis]
MRYTAQREHVVRAVSQLTRWGSLDPNGGAISVRTDSGDIVSTTAGGPLNHWDISTRDTIVYDAEGGVVERITGHAPVDTPLHLAAYREFEHCHALVHAHAPYSLAFASLGLGVPTVTTRSDLLGEVPCFTFDEAAAREDVATGRAEVRVPDCMRSRPESIAGYELGLIPHMLEQIGPRAGELKAHGVGFVAYRHGVFILANNLTAAVASLHNIECTARTALFQAILHGGIAGIEPDVLLGGLPAPDGGALGAAGS